MFLNDSRAICWSEWKHNTRYSYYYASSSCAAKVISIDKHRPHAFAQFLMSNRRLSPDRSVLLTGDWSAVMKTTVNKLQRRRFWADSLSFSFALRVTSLQWAAPRDYFWDVLNCWFCSGWHQNSCFHHHSTEMIWTQPYQERRHINPSPTVWHSRPTWCILKIKFKKMFRIINVSWNVTVSW